MNFPGVDGALSRCEIDFICDIVGIKNHRFQYLGLRRRKKTKKNPNFRFAELGLVGEKERRKGGRKAG